MCNVYLDTDVLINIYLNAISLSLLTTDNTSLSVYLTGSFSNSPQSDNVGQSGASPNPADHGDIGSLSTVARLAE